MSGKECVANLSVDSGDSRKFSHAWARDCARTRLQAGERGEGGRTDERSGAPGTTVPAQDDRAPRLWLPNRQLKVACSASSTFLFPSSSSLSTTHLSSTHPLPYSNSNSDMSEKASSLERGAPAMEHGQVKDKPTMEHEEYYKHKSGYSHGIAAIAEVSCRLVFRLGSYRALVGGRRCGGPRGRPQPPCLLWPAREPKHRAHKFPSRLTLP